MEPTVQVYIYPRPEGFYLTTQPLQPADEETNGRAVDQEIIDHWQQSQAELKSIFESSGF